jgi:hypothetical protein
MRFLSMDDRDLPRLFPHMHAATRNWMRSGRVIEPGETIA